jgi:mono/diheme cytochrome c family protein
LLREKSSRSAVFGVFLASTMALAGGFAFAQDAPAPATPEATPEAAPAEAGAAPAGDGLTIYSGVFTEEQAARGATAYSQNCAVCHGNTARGGSDAPGITGHTFNSKYAGQPLFAYFHYMQTRMPLGRGNSLPVGTYVDILAHLLTLQGAPAGDTDLPSDEASLTAIQIVPAP